MKQLIPLLAVVTLFLLAACQTQPTPPAQPTAQPPAPTAVPVQPTAVSAEIPSAEPTVEPTTEPAAQPPAQPTAQPPAQPTAQLFANAFDDREPYRAGLRPGSQDILEQLPGAPVYHMVLEMGDDPTVLIGQQQLAYTNQEDIALNEIYFHQFPNLLGGQMSISNVTVNDSAVVAEDFDTILRVPLAAPLQPGEQAIISMEFTTIVPTESGRNYGILAYVDDILALAHFYPMLAVYDQDGWDTEPAPDGGDVTYADTSFFQVRLTAPASQTIATAGVQTDRKNDGISQTVTYAAGPVRDFYIAMSETYEQATTQVDGITINSYAPAALRPGAEATLDYAANALQIYSAHYGDYPYTEFDMVGTPTLALGVEYPGIIANTLSIYDLEDPSRSIWLESTTAHEVGHQWFYNLIGNDQLDAPWLDESLTQFATWQYFQDRYGDEGGEAFYDSFDQRWSSVQYETIPVGLPVEAYNGREYSGIVYGRGPIFFHELRNQLGEEAFDAFIREYSETYRWQIASAEALQTLAEKQCACDLALLFADWIDS